MEQTTYKSTINTALNKHKNVIDKCIYIYGGQTETTPEKRLNQHQQNKKDKNYGKFKNMTSIQLFTFKKTITVNEIKLAEQYLINELHKRYGSKCINDINNDGNMANRGATGVNHNENDIHTLYITYK